MFGFSHSSLSLPSKYQKLEDFKDLTFQQQCEVGVRFTQVLASELKLRNIPRLYISFDPFMGSCFHGLTNLIFINIGQLGCYAPIVDPLVVIAHEIRHAWQQETGRLVLSTPDSVNALEWEGSLYSLSAPHNELPWEIDAIEYERSIAQRLRMRPFPRPLTAKEAELPTNMEDYLSSIFKIPA